MKTAPNTRIEADGGNVAFELRLDSAAAPAKRSNQKIDRDSTAWREEVRKRCVEIDQGAIELRDAADVFANANATLG